MWFPQYESKEQRLQRERDHLEKILIGAIVAVSDGQGIRVGLVEDILDLRSSQDAALRRVVELEQRLEDRPVNTQTDQKETQ